MLLQTLFCVLFLFYEFRVDASENSRIIGGIPSYPGSTPHIVHLDAYGSYFCGGSLISESWVLSAAHCFVFSSFNVVLGDYDLTKNEGTEQTISLSIVISHPQYNTQTKENDLMLVKLSIPATLNQFVQPIRLPAPFSEPFANQKCNVCGWGNHQISGNAYPDILRCVEIPVVSRCACNDVTSYNGLVKENMICIGDMNGGKDACDGDSGGPAECCGRLLGVVSWGYGCAYPNFPGVYVKVSWYIEWIENVTGFS